MGIGASIFLIAVGAIIAFALEARVGWLDLDVVGWVLMLAGLFGLLLSFGLFSRTRRTVVAGRERRVYESEQAVPPAPRTVVGSGAVVDPTLVEPPAERRVTTQYEETERPL